MHSVRGVLVMGGLVLGLAGRVHAAPATIPQVATSGGVQANDVFKERAAALAALAGVTSCHAPEQVQVHTAAANQTIWAVISCRASSKASAVAVVRIGATGGVAMPLGTTADPSESLAATRISVYAPHGGELICAEHAWDDESPPRTSQTTTCLAWKGGALNQLFSFTAGDAADGHDYSIALVDGSPPAINVADAFDRDLDGVVDATSIQSTPLPSSAFDAPVAAPRAARVEADGSVVGLPAISADGTWVAVEENSHEVGETSYRVTFMPLGKGESTDHVVMRHCIDTAGDDEGNFAPSEDIPDAGEIAAANQRLAAGNFQPVADVPGVTFKKVEGKRATTVTFTEKRKQVGRYKTEDSVGEIFVIRGAGRGFALIQVESSDFDMGSNHSSWELAPLKLAPPPAAKP